MNRLSRILLERGLATEADLSIAAEAAKRLQERFGAALIKLGAVSEKQLISVASEATGIPELSPNEAPSIASVGEGMTMFAFTLEELTEMLAVVWPNDGVIHAAGPYLFEPSIQEALSRKINASFVTHLWSSQQTTSILRTLQTSRSISPSELGAESLRELADQAPVIHFVNSLLSDAAAMRASDIHIETLAGRYQVRLRVDGVLRPWRSAIDAGFEAIASRLKLLSGIDIGERRLPQDGRQRVRVAGLELDMRVSTLPTRWGESVVVRLLGNSRDLPDFEGLGMDADHAGQIRSLIGLANGLILLTGPTGSGKTTTVYRMLSDLNDGQRKIITVEDPIEMDLAGVTQTQVQPAIGLTFATALRAILRQDPDIIFVGEIRDPETAKIAVQAALTGHLVISTVHTNSAFAAVWRMLDLGIEPYLLSEVLRGVAGQRLVRRLCTVCSAIDETGSGDEHRPVGCEACAHTGYRGRLGLFEICAVNESLRAAIRRQASEADIVEIARKSGYRTLFEDGTDKSKRALTSRGEVNKVRT